MSDEIQVQEARAVVTMPQPPAPISPLGLIEKAIEKNWTAEQLLPLYELYKEVESARAEERYAVAMANFQKQMPLVMKAKQADIRSKSGGGAFSYNYAGIDDIMAVAAEPLASNGIVVSFRTHRNGECMEVTCKVRVGSYVEENMMPVPIPPPSGGYANPAQLIAQAVSYGKRYSLMAMLNINATDEDKDASDLYEFISPVEKANLERLMEESDTRPIDFLRWAFTGFSEVGPLERMPRFRYLDGVRLLNDKIKGKKVPQ